MQSLRRQLKRGSAVFVQNFVTKEVEVIRKKGTPKKVWNRAQKDRLLDFEQSYIQWVTSPINN